MKGAILCAIPVCFLLCATIQAQNVEDCNLVPIVIGCDGLQCQTLKAGPQEYNAGQVCAGIDEDALNFYFAAAEGWYFKKIELWIGDSLDDVPQDPNGCPIPEDFPYQSGDISETEYTVSYPLEYLQFICSEEDQKYYVVAHAEVSTEVYGDLSAWAGNILICSEGGGAVGDVDEADLSGCITWDSGDGGITGLTADGNINDWLNNGTSLCWDVTYNNDGTWTYSYTLDVNSPKNISHFILEVSDAFEESNYLSGPEPDLDTYSGASPSNPGMPGSMKGIKFNVNSNDWTLTFDSNRAPTWGDFYAVDGKKDGETPAIWNVGFTGSDTPYKTENDEWDHIVVPDTDTVSEVEKAYACKITIKCNCEGRVDCGEIDIEVDPNDLVEWFNDPNTTWSPNIPVHNPYSGIYSDPNVTPTEDVIYDANYLQFLDLCPCDVSTYPAYELNDDPSLTLLRGGIVDDGGDACRVAFIFWPEGGSPVMSPWTDAIYETGDTFSFSLDNLEPDTTYFYQALAKNSVSMAVGHVRYFTTPSF